MDSSGKTIKEITQASEIEANNRLTYTKGNSATLAEFLKKVKNTKKEPKMAYFDARTDIPFSVKNWDKFVIISEMAMCEDYKDRVEANTALEPFDLKLITGTEDIGAVNIFFILLRSLTSITYYAVKELNTRYHC